MRPRRMKDQHEIITSSKYYLANPSEHKGKFHELFGNNNPIRLEIGIGKGDFIIGMAEKYPDINFIGVEVQESVIVRAIKKLDNKKLPNVYVMMVNADKLEDIIDHEIDTLHLNFSDPWPKTRHAKRRLTSESFLNIYDNLFKGEPHIIQKTDNILLFAYSIEELVKHGYVFNKVSLDLANEDIDNVETEYEHKFKSKGERINYLDAVKHTKK
jgi:tRNA (guanine-N7-)-methyltransferase